jgi:hypothetical protein
MPAPGKAANLRQAAGEMEDAVAPMAGVAQAAPMAMKAEMERGAAEPAMPKKKMAGPMGRAAMDDDMLLGGDDFGGGRMGAAARGLPHREVVVRPRPRPVEPWAPVRVFPVPSYQPDYTGPRTDFRETVFWSPAVQTGQDGKAQVSFFLSDAVTSFRVQTEAIGGGAAGRDETVVKSSLPFSMAVKLPVPRSAKAIGLPCR